VASAIIKIFVKLKDFGKKTYFIKTIMKGLTQFHKGKNSIKIK